MSEYKNISWISFDVGGTLLYPYPSVGHIYGRVFKKYGIEAEAEHINASFFSVWEKAHLIKRDAGPGTEKKWWREIVRRVLSELGGTPHEDSVFDELWETFCHPENWRLYEGAEDVLSHLRAAGYRLGILSNWDERLRPLLEKLDLIKYFDTVIISCEVGAEKPHVGIFEAFLKSANTLPHNVLHIGDSEHHDKAGAETAGLHCLLVSPGSTETSKLSDLRKIPELLAQGL